VILLENTLPVKANELRTSRKMRAQNCASSAEHASLHRDEKEELGDKANA
jgi:hypothetical protein